ncbi:MAG: hypothetical protein WAN30_07310 [Acidimicrobiales bacterium]
MIATRLTIGFGLAIYILLWVLALNGASSLVAPLLVPLVLAVLVAAGVALNRYLGIEPRKQHFRDRDGPSS